MWAGVILEACLASHLSHWFLRMATWAPFGSTPVHPTPVISSFSLHFLSLPISSRSDLRISTGCASLAQASTTQRKKLINVRNVQWEDYVPIMKIDVIVVCNFRPRRLFSSLSSPSLLKGSTLFPKALCYPVQSWCFKETEAT